MVTSQGTGLPLPSGLSHLALSVTASASWITTHARVGIPCSCCSVVVVVAVVEGVTFSEFLWHGSSSTSLTLSQTLIRRIGPISDPVIWDSRRKEPSWREGECFWQLTWVLAVGEASNLALGTIVVAVVLVVVVVMFVVVVVWQPGTDLEGEQMVDQSLSLTE